MEIRATGCLLCGSPLKYFVSAKNKQCSICGSYTQANATCERGHYVCDRCHADRACLQVKAAVLSTRLKNPFLIAQQAMHSEFVSMHGPEHHYLVSASLLAAYKNSGGEIDLEEAVKIAIERGRGVPGGVCGLWGSCGAAIAAGIFVSIITGATPLSDNEWKLANKVTAMCLDKIAAHGGIRCCKRNSFLALSCAVDFAKEHLGVQMEQQDNMRCSFFAKNDRCKKEACLFYPAGLKLE